MIDLKKLCQENGIDLDIGEMSDGFQEYGTFIGLVDEEEEDD